MKKISLLLIGLFILLIAFSGCKKYEEGPVFSLASKKSRVVNVWKIDKYIENGVDYTAQVGSFISLFSLEYKKDNTYIVSASTFSGAETGTWSFDTKKEKIVMTPNGGSSAYVEEILRLKSKEMWLKETNGSDTYEIHYVTR